MSSSITFQDPQWWLWLVLAAVTLIPFAWRSLKAGSKAPFPWGAFAARSTAVLLLALSLADPHLITQRPITGANVLAVVADNSESLRVKEGGSEILDRGEDMRQWLAGSRSAWIAEVEEAYQVRQYQFDRELRRVSSFEALDFQGDRSNLSAALSELRSRLDHMPIAGIALFTDGNATDALDLPEDLSGFPPIFPIVSGNEAPQRDIAVIDTQLRQSAFDDAPLDLSASIATNGLRGENVEVTLSRLDDGSKRRLSSPNSSADSVIDVKRLRVDDSSPESLRFQWTPTETGIQFYELQARPLGDDSDEADESLREATKRNNGRLMVVDSGKSAYRILYLSGRPNWEYKYLNRALADDPQLDLVALMRVANREPKFEFKGRSGESSNPLFRGFGREDETQRYDQPVLVRLNTRDERELSGGFPTEASELFQYDAIIVDDLEADFFNFSQLTLIREFVNQRGGGLLMLGGASALDDGGYRASPLDSVLPVYLDPADRTASSDAALRWDLTREGWVEPWARVRPLESEEQRRLEQMPNLRVLNALPRVKPGARALAIVESATGENYPALITRNFGSGRVAVITVGDLWRWGLQGAGEQADLARFWRQTTRWLVKDAPQKVQLAAETQPDGSVRLLATARDEQYRPLELGTAELTITKVSEPVRSEGEDSSFQSIELPMDPVPSKAGQFSVEAPLKDAGAYRAAVEVSDAAGVSLGMAETGWVTQPAVAEFASIAPNRALLERLATETGGRVLEPNELDELPEELAARPSPLMETWADPLWHKHWVFALALGCLLIEWGIRRRKGYP